MALRSSAVRCVLGLWIASPRRCLRGIQETATAFLVASRPRQLGFVIRRGDVVSSQRQGIEEIHVTDREEVVWPTGMSDRDPPARSRPLVFHPEGFLVAIVEDSAQAERARADLISAGFVDGDLRVYTGEQMLGDWERYNAEKGTARRIVGALTDDQETIELYYGYAREGRSALWVHVPDKEDANRALRRLADHNVLYARHYGHDRQTDIHME